MAVSFNLDGQAYTFPDWATEATAAEMLDMMKKIAASSGMSKDKQEKLAKSTENLIKEVKNGNTADTKNNDDQKKRDEKLLKASEQSNKDFKELKKSLDDYKIDQAFNKSVLGTFANNFEKDGEVVGKAIFTLGGTLVKGASMIGGALVGAGTFLGNTLLSAGNELNDLAKSGVGFNSSIGSMNKTAGMAVSSLSGLTGGFKASSRLIGQFSNVVAVGTIDRFSNTMKFAADTSEELGLSFEDSMEQFGDALSRRQQLLNIGNIDQQRVNKQVQTTVKSQMAYATALGVSTVELQSFVDSLVRNNGMLSASLIGFSDTVRSDVIAGVEVFASGLAATGGKAGEDIAAAFLDAGTTGAIGLSDAATGFVTALPSLAGPINEFATAMQNGTLSQDQARDMVTGLTKNLGNLDQGEKDRIFAMARIGDEAAKTMAQAITQFEQSEEKIDEINKMFGTAFDMDAVQTGTNNFNKMLTQVTGGFSNAFYSLFANDEVMGVIQDGMNEIFQAFGLGVDDLSGAAMGAGDMVQKFVPAIKSFVTSLVNVAKDVAGFFAQFKTDDGFDFGAMFEAVGGKIKSAILKAIGGFVLLWLGGTVALTAAKQYLMPAAGKFASQLFSQGPGIAKNLASKASGFISTMFKSDTAKQLQQGIFALGGKLSEKFKNVKIPGMDMAKNLQGKAVEKLGTTGIGGKVGGFLKSTTDKADDVTSKMTSGGKSGDFLKSLANGVKKFGDNKTVKGAASLALLGGAITLAAVGLKQFNEVNFTSLIKGTIALAGLAGLAQLLGKGSTAMIKGAAAVALLGAAVVPMAFGLSLMKDVGFDTILNMGAGLVVLGAAAAGLGLALPFILAGSVAIAAMGAALIPFAFGVNLLSKSLPLFTEGLERMSMIDGGNLAGAAGGLLAVGGAMALMAPLLPFMLLGSLAGPALEKMGIALSYFNIVDAENLRLIGPAMASIAAGMSALSGGALMSGLKDGIGSLFGAESPIDKIKNFAGALSEIDVHPLLDVAYALESLVTSSQHLDTAGDEFEAFSEQVSPFIRKMVVLSHSIEDMGSEPFAVFNTLGPLSESSLKFASSVDSINNSLDNVDGEYISDQFMSIGDSIQYMNEQLEGVNFGSIVKLGAMKMFGPSKADKQAEEQKQAVSNTAYDKLYGNAFDGPGLTQIMEGLQSKNADMFVKQNYGELARAGINADQEALIGKKGGEGFREELKRVQLELQTQIDMYKMQEATGVVAANVPTTNQVAPQVTETPGTPGTPGAAEALKSTFGGDTPDTMSTTDMLLERIAKLQEENNRLLKKETRAISELDL